MIPQIITLISFVITLICQIVVLVMMIKISKRR